MLHQPPINELAQYEFKQSSFLLLGTIYFSLLMYWVQSFRFDGPRRWMVFSLLSGISFGAVATMEWGIALAGTAFALGVCLCLALMDAGVAMCLLASSLFLRPWELQDQDQWLGILPRLSFLLCIGHLLLFYARQGRVKIVTNMTTLVILGFTLWCFITTLFAPDPSSAQAVFFGGLLKSVFLYLILIQMLRDHVDLKRLVVTLVLSFLFVASLSIFKTIKMETIASEIEMRLQGFGAFANSNDIAALMVFILPFAFVFARRRMEHPVFRAVCWILGIIALVTIILSGSRGALLGVGAMIAIHFLMKQGRRVLVPVGIGMILIAGPAALLVTGRDASDLEGSSAGRVTYFKAGMRMGVKNPIFGVGFDAFPVSLQRYSTESLEESQTMTAHNSWLLVFAETGFIGLILFTIAFILTVQGALKIYHQEPAFLLSIAGYGVSIFFLSHSYLIYLYMLYALIQSASSFRRLKL